MQDDGRGSEGNEQELEGGLLGLVSRESKREYQCQNEVVEVLPIQEERGLASGMVRRTEDDSIRA